MKVFALQRIAAIFVRDGGFWLLQAKIRAGEWRARRETDRHPENSVKIVGPDKHQQHRQQRAEKGADGIQRRNYYASGSPSGGAADLRQWGDVGDQRIARRAAKLSNDDLPTRSIMRALNTGEPGGWGDGKQRQLARPEAVASSKRQSVFTLAEP